MKHTVLLLALAISTLLAFGQPGAAPPAFEVASVRIHKAASAEEPGNGRWMQTSPGGLTIRNAKLLWCLGWAYDERDWLILGPEWINSERYDIVAKTGGAVPLSQLKLMLQTLLVERFKLVLHRETKEFPVAVLVLAKNGPRNLEPAAAIGPPDGPRPVGGKQGLHSLIYKNVSMLDFAERLGGPPNRGGREGDRRNRSRWSF